MEINEPMLIQELSENPEKYLKLLKKCIAIYDKHSKTITVDVSKKVIGIGGKECFVCGKAVTRTRHHAIPRELKPLMNATIPLCEEHKDIMHHIVKQLYVPKDIRKKINMTLTELNNAMGRIKSVKASFKIHKANHNHSIERADCDSTNTPSD